MKTLTETVEFMIRNMTPTEKMVDMSKTDIEKIKLVAAIYNVTPSFLFRLLKNAVDEWNLWWVNDTHMDWI